MIGHEYSNNTVADKYELDASKHGGSAQYRPTAHHCLVDGLNEDFEVITLSELDEH